MKIEVGKWYRNGVGEVIRIEEYDVKETHPYAGDNGARYRQDGQWRGASSREHFWNLISEVPDDPGPKWEALLVVLRELADGNESAQHAILQLERALDEEGTQS